MNPDEKNPTNTTALRKLIKPLFKEVGFRRHGDIQSWTSAEVVVLVGFTSAYNRLFFDTGFWLCGLSSIVPAKVYKCHIYDRLEQYFPSLRPEIIDAGDCSCNDYKARVETFRLLLHSTIAPSLKSLASEAALIERFIARPDGPAPMPAYVSEYLRSRVS